MSGLFTKKILPTMPNIPVINPKPTTEKILGVDLSHHNAYADWNKAKAAGVKFAFFKATEGTTFVDDKYEKQSAAARAAGIPCGAYHFFRYKGGDPIKQAEHFCKTIKYVPVGDLPPVADIEWADRLDSITEDAAHDAWKFINHVEALTIIKPIIYTAAGFFTGLKDPSAFKDYYLWVANYGVSKPRIPKPWSQQLIWQFSESYSVPGIGNCDANWLNCSLEDLEKLRKK